MIPRKLWGPPFFLDANRVNARQKLPATNQLEKWQKDGVISLRFPEHAQAEAESGCDARRTRKARDFFIPLALITTDDERMLLNEIKRIIFGEGPFSRQDENDATIVFTAKKYSAILVTADRKVLRAADELHRRVGVQVMTDENAVKLIRMMISQRDRMAHAEAARNSPLPEWVGKD